MCTVNKIEKFRTLSAPSESEVISSSAALEQVSFVEEIKAYNCISAQFICSNRDVYIAIALFSKLLHSAIAIVTSRLKQMNWVYI
jgi:hypothetical protein